MPTNPELFSLERLDWTIYLSMIGAMVVLAMPREKKDAIRWTALLFAVSGLALALYGLFHYQILGATPAVERGDALTQFRRSIQFEVRYDWIPALGAVGASYHLGADGISLPILVLNGIVAVTGVLFSWNIENRTKEFFVLFLTLIGGVYGVFLSLDVFLLFAFYELAIIPKYFVIAIWGSTRKEYGAMKLVLYSFIGSALVFIGVLALYFAAGGQSFDFFDTTLRNGKIVPGLLSAKLGTEFQFWCFPLIFVGFGVLAGMWPFHTWAPTGHVAAPTAASMLLAGVVMKLGAFGCLRVAMLLLPEGMTAHGGFWMWTFATLAVIGIVYGAGVAWVQKDFKFVIGYSSVSHMGFVLLGLMALNQRALEGAVLQMFSHGVIASLLFAVVGRMVYERTHTRDLDELSAMRLARKMPFVCATFIVGGLASMGLPGFSGFVAELNVLVGVWQSIPGIWPLQHWLASFIPGWLPNWLQSILDSVFHFPFVMIGAGVGIVITVAYTFRAIHKAFYGDQQFSNDATAEPALAHDAHPLAPITWQEKLGAYILMALLVIIGLYPTVLLNPISYSVKLMLPLMTAGH